MKLLQLVVRNHRSFRDEFFLDLTMPSLSAKLPKKGQTWADVIYPVAAIYGANASGKTNVLQALHYISSAIAHSGGEWLGSKNMKRDPFWLEEESREGSSFYGLDVVLPIDSRNPSQAAAREERYHYEFTTDRDGIVSELLQVYRSSRPTTLLERTHTKQRKHLVKIAAGTGRKLDVAARELALSRALVTDHEYFAPIAAAFLAGIEMFNVGDTERNYRLQKITEELAAGEINPLDLVTLAQLADIGIRDVRVDERDIPEAVVNLIQLLSDGVKQLDHSTDEGEISLTAERVRKYLKFSHSDMADDDGLLSLENESAGTLAWLALAVPIINSLRNGTLLCVDELDASLHPHLVVEIVRWFQNPETNPHGAQLIFTTHDVTMLMPQSELGLRPHQVWIVEKAGDGSSELYSLGDFSDLKEKSNVAKQFLEGRFGGIPRLAPAIIHSLTVPAVAEEQPIG
jgi:hypothetical protein